MLCTYQGVDKTYGMGGGTIWATPSLSRLHEGARSSQTVYAGMAVKLRRRWCRISINKGTPNTGIGEIQK